MVGPYGVTVEEVMGFKNFVRQAVFVIAQDGTVRYNGVADDPGQLPDALKVLEVKHTLTQLRRQNFGGHHQSR